MKIETTGYDCGLQSIITLLQTWALSPDGNAGLDTSSRMGSERSAMDCFRGRERCVNDFNDSVNKTVMRLLEKGKRNVPRECIITGIMKRKD